MLAVLRGFAMANLHLLLAPRNPLNAPLEIKFPLRQATTSRCGGIAFESLPREREGLVDALTKRGLPGQSFLKYQPTSSRAATKAIE
jgi:hypothetical protein